MRTFSFICIALLLVFAGCKKEDTKTPFVGFTSPANFPPPTYSFTGNTVTEPGFLLGKKLFYDGRLSRDGSISCASCHISFSAFSHVDHSVSHGIDDRLGTRNAPAVQNMAWERFFFWDGGVFDLDLFSINPIQNHDEMDDTIPNVIAKLKADPEYVRQFKAAFGTEEVTPTRMFQALSQFMCMLVSNDSKYDKVLKGTASFTSAESLGKTAFEQKCASCHSGILFTDRTFKNNGLSLTADLGRGRVTLNPNDEHCFKVPSLRNIAKTYPYMHDGRFSTLERVLDHYASGVQNTPTLDTLLKPNGQLGIPLTNDEKANIILFLNTLTDETFIKNPLFAQ